MSLFKRNKKDNNQVCVICETEEDVKKLWQWAYKNGYETAYREMTEFLKEFENYCSRPCMRWNEDKQELEDIDVDGALKYIQPPMYCIDPQFGSVLIILDSPYIGTEKSKDYRERQRQNAMVASEIDFDNLKV